MAEVESRTQGLRPRPRTQKKSEAKDSLFEDRHSRGQGQECSRPRTKNTSTSALQKKKGLHKHFSGDLKKNGLHKNFSGNLHKKTFSNKFFKRSSRFLQFKKYCCPRATDRPIFEDSRPRPRTSKCVLEDSTSVKWIGKPKQCQCFLSTSGLNLHKKIFSPLKGLF